MYGLAISFINSYPLSNQEAVDSISVGPTMQHSMSILPLRFNIADAGCYKIRLKRSYFPTRETNRGCSDGSFANPSMLANIHNWSRDQWVVAQRRLVKRMMSGSTTQATLIFISILFHECTKMCFDKAIKPKQKPI